MSKVAVVFWSGTGNTQAMADAVADGAKAAGAEVTVFSSNDFGAANVAEYDGIATGRRMLICRFFYNQRFDIMKSSISGT